MQSRCVSLAFRPASSLSLSTHIFGAQVIHSQVHGAERAAANLLPDDVLVDAVDGRVIPDRVRLQVLLDDLVGGRLATVVTEGAFVGRGRADQAER